LHKLEVGFLAKLPLAPSSCRSGKLRTLQTMNLSFSKSHKLAYENLFFTLEVIPTISNTKIILFRKVQISRPYDFPSEQNERHSVRCPCELSSFTHTLLLLRRMLWRLLIF